MPMRNEPQLIDFVLSRGVFPKRANFVKALMQAIDSREQESLIRTCRKLRDGDIVRYISELTHLEVEE